MAPESTRTQCANDPTSPAGAASNPAPPIPPDTDPAPASSRPRARLLVTPYPDPRDPLKLANELLIDLQLIATGRFGDGAIPVFSKSNRQIAVICDLKRLSYSDLLDLCPLTVRRDFGAGGRRSLAAKSRYMRRVRDAIGMLADSLGSVRFYGRPRRPKRAVVAGNREMAA